MERARNNSMYKVEEKAKLRHVLKVFLFFTGERERKLIIISRTNSANKFLYICYTGKKWKN